MTRKKKTTVPADFNEAITAYAASVYAYTLQVGNISNWVKVIANETASLCLQLLRPTIPLVEGAGKMLDGMTAVTAFFGNRAAFVAAHISTITQKTREQLDADGIPTWDAAESAYSEAFRKVSEAPRE